MAMVSMNGQVSIHPVTRSTHHQRNHHQLVDGKYPMIPSGKHTHNYGKSMDITFFHGKINELDGDFPYSYVTNYQRLIPCLTFFHIVP